MFGLQPTMFGAAQAQSAPGFGAANGSTPSFAFGQQPSNGSAPTFGQPSAAPAFGQSATTPAFGQSAAAPAFGQAQGGMASSFSGSFQSGVSTFAAGTTSNAPAARRKVAVRRRK